MRKCETDRLGLSMRVLVVVPGWVTSLPVSVYKLMSGFDNDLIFSPVWEDSKGVSYSRVIMGLALNTDESISEGRSGVVDYEPRVVAFVSNSFGYGIDFGPAKIAWPQIQANKKVHIFIHRDDRGGGLLPNCDEARESRSGMFNRVNVTKTRSWFWRVWSNTPK